MPPSPMTTTFALSGNSAIARCSAVKLRADYRRGRADCSLFATAGCRVAPGDSLLFAAEKPRQLRGWRWRQKVNCPLHLAERPHVLGVDADAVARRLQLDQHVADVGRRQRADLDLDHAGAVAGDVELLEDD